MWGSSQIEERKANRQTHCPTKQIWCVWRCVLCCQPGPRHPLLHRGQAGGTGWSLSGTACQQGMWKSGRMAGMGYQRGRSWEPKGPLRWGQLDENTAGGKVVARKEVMERCRKCGHLFQNGEGPPDGLKETKPVAKCSVTWARGKGGGFLPGLEGKRGCGDGGQSSPLSCTNGST